MTSSNVPARPCKRQHGPGKPGKPALVQRHSHTKPHHRPNSSRAKTEITVVEEPVEEDAMSATFPQFCAVCDKQILIPSSVLYCSEKCRRQDSSDSPAYALFKNDASPASTPSATTPPPTSSESLDIIPQLSPTLSSRQLVHPPQLSSETSAPDAENLNSSAYERQSRPSSGRKDSEAARYLAQFQPTTQPSSQSSYGRSTGITTPGLSLTPTSAASASMPFTPFSTASSYTAVRHHNPRWSTSAFSTRSADLVTPIAHCPTAPSSLTTITDKLAETGIDETSMATPRAAGEGLSYEKRSPTMSPGHSSLKQLFEFDAMRAKPLADQRRNQ